MSVEPAVESNPALGDKITTVQQHILKEQKRFPGASGQFSWLLSGITLAAKVIQAQVRRAGLGDILGSEDRVNVQGEVQQKLDVSANRREPGGQAAAALRGEPDRVSRRGGPGGVATDGKQPILMIAPTSIHQRTPLVVGGRVEMEEFARCVG